MELPEGGHDIVHPEVRAHITSLISALGGISADDDGQYQLGDDALEVLRDIKRWIRFYDEKTNRMDVARCLYQGNLIQGDLIPILAKWPEESMDNKFKSRIALSCFEVMVPLTWPIEQDKEKMTVNHHRHIPVLQLAQLQYKSAIINFDSTRLLHSAVRSALPSMAIPIGDRTPRDQGIIKLILFFLRNIAMIEPSPSIKFDGDETQISRSATIDAFSYQDVFIILLTIASNVGEDFRTEDTTVMEIIYHLVKQVDIDKLFMSESQLNKVKAVELSDLMKKESATLRAHNTNAPTRHNRFGTMVWVKRDDGKTKPFSGQEALADGATRDKKMDDSKTFRPPRRGRKEDKSEKDLGLPTPLTPSAAKQLRSFVEEFLDSGFNPLFLHIRKSIDREAPHVLDFHRRQFFYLISWFLEAERGRRKQNKAANKKAGEEVSSFNLIASVLNQEMFITLSKGLHESFDHKDWHSLSAAMRCFTQILLTIQEMIDEGTEDDQEIADNVLSRLFYEETTHDVIANIARTYKDQGFEYLDAATELVHHFLRVLEAYSKQNADMQIRSRKRARRKKRAETQQNGGDDEDDEDSGQDGAAVERTSKERKFDFARFTSRFTPQGVVDTFMAFTKYYRELNDVQLKRAHRYFYRLAFKKELSVMVFRVDMLHLLSNMVRGPDALAKSSKMFKDWEELNKQLFRKCFKKIRERPELIIEMLFSKDQAAAHFLEYGFAQQTSAARGKPRPAAELVFKHTTEHDQQVGIAVGALLDKNESDHIQWLKNVISTAGTERRSWNNANDELLAIETLSDAEMPETQQEPKPPPIITVRPDSPERRTAMFKNPYLRLLMDLTGIRLLGPAAEETAESVWIIPAEITASQLKDALHYINQAEFNPPTFEDGTSAEQQLKRKTAPRKKAAFDDEEADDGDDLDDFLDNDIMFPAGGPTARNAIDESKKPKKSRKKRSVVQEIDDQEREDRARKRRDKEREKARKIKSALYVKDGDDEFDSDEDEEFFARERAIKARAEQAAKSAVHGLANDDRNVLARPAAKRKSEALLDDSTDGEDDVDDAGSTQRILSSHSVADASETDDTEVGGSGAERPKRPRLSPDTDDEEDAAMDDAEPEDDSTSKPAAGPDEDGDDVVAAPTSTARKSRVRGGFVIDSDDDE
ncbi:drug resistance protein MdrA [Cordyceps fumosorosea ARSEF 2679]|uniref:Topoisomerase 1-associated factor 1 n=1 Tax=Cordyceps fumosorosea (strain ARSEF 2679) TaxID=1081104 RepID=A0A167ZLT2_CORFA|nr:drug resistance protein MdrA [Cordyceps fumosorosea ARSEF 2679]OAA67669.1 drug resistance protein MdrA [Cordyceps fumosorosea ARSEF 2679]